MFQAEISDFELLAGIRFGYLHPYKVAGMGEPWRQHIQRTLELLRKEGIGAVLTLTEDDPFGRDYLEADFWHRHIPVDDGEPPSPQAMNQAVDFIQSALAEDLPVAVHCLEGRGRTGVILCGWLARVEALAPDAAIRRVRDLRYHTVFSPSQRAFLEAHLVRP
ncbi:MAG: dual specificity protein phosphatase family protein [Thermodesulfobacteriota bacterium]